jgi:ribosomal protein S12 methylthiotransferase accessory factor
MSYADLIGLETRTPIDVSLGRLRRLVSSRFGVVRHVGAGMRFRDEVSLPFYYSETTTSFVGDGGGVTQLQGEVLNRPHIGGGGCYPDPDRAIAAAIGETVERYSACFVAEESVIFGSQADLASDGALPVEAFRYFTSEQLASPGFDCQALTETDNIAWVRGIALGDGCPVLAPGQLIHFDSHEFRRAFPNEPRLAPVTSNGLACGSTQTEAALAAVLELLERDAIMIVWYNELSLPRLDWSTDRLCTEFGRRYFEATQLHYEAVDLTQVHGIPTVLGVVSDPVAGSISLGGASAVSQRIAWEKALGEAFMCNIVLTNLGSSRKKRLGMASAQDVNSFEDRVAFYGSREHSFYASFLTESTLVTTLEDGNAMPALPPGRLLEWLGKTLASRGTDIYLFDVTSPDIADVGLSVVRAFAPTLCPLNADERHGFFGVRRLRDGAVAAGFRPRDTFYPWPHPFP